MSRKKVLSQSVGAVPLNFLLTCSENHLGEYELNKLAEVANTRQEMHEVLDRLVDLMGQASLVRWFRAQDREAIKHALDNPDDVIEIAKERIRAGQRSDEELIPRAVLPPGSAHLAAALRYQKRNLEQGLCTECPEPLDRNSVRYCTKHLQNARLRYKPKNAKGARPGSIGWLHGEGFESQHGRMPGTLQATNITRQKKTRAILADMGLPLGKVDTAKQAAKDTMLAIMPQSKKEALLFWEVLDRAKLESYESTTKHALVELVSSGLVQRIGKGIRGNPFLYFAGSK
jgi:hypothetical protein